MPFLVRVIIAAAAAAGCAAAIGYARQPALVRPDVLQAPMPMKAVQLMLWLAEVEAGDMVYDLGCRDPRIVITAARRFGAWGVCVDIDPRRIAESREQARRAGVADRIRFANEDFFATPIGDATKVILLLSRELNLRLRPKLLRELRPGTRVVSFRHDMGDWKPEQTAYVRSGGQDGPVYLWMVPEW
jgi:SAM-dependent methyltransferase